MLFCQTQEVRLNVRKRLESSHISVRRLAVIRRCRGFLETQEAVYPAASGGVWHLTMILLGGIRSCRHMAEGECTFWRRLGPSRISESPDSFGIWSPFPPCKSSEPLLPCGVNSDGPRGWTKSMSHHEMSYHG